MPSLLGYISNLLPGTKKTSPSQEDKSATRIKELTDLGITADMLKAGVEALRAYQSPDASKDPNISVIDETVPPPEALPLLAAFCHSNYCNNVSYLQKLLKPYDFELREVRREHQHGWLSKHKEGDQHNPKYETPPYVRIWYLQPNGTTTRDPGPVPEGWTSSPIIEHTGGLMIVSFTGSTTGADWKDDLRAFTHTSASFLHPDLEAINSHHGFADWLTRRLDTQAKLQVDAPAKKDDLFAPGKRVIERTDPTVYNATLSAIADLRRGTNVKGAGKIKMIVTGHSLGGAVASLFSLRLSSAGKWDMTDAHDINCLDGNPDTGANFGDHVLPVDLELAVTFGAPRFLWHGIDDKFEAKREAQRATLKAEMEKKAKDKANGIDPNQTNHGYQPRGKYVPDLLTPPRIEDTPLARIVMQRDPVPHVPAGSGELPLELELNVLRVEQKPQRNTVVLESQGPQAGDGAHTDGISIPQESNLNTYVHLGHQWVLGGVKPLEKLPSQSDKYLADTWGLFKDLVTHNPWNNSIASQHYMSTYLMHAAKAYEANQSQAKA